MQFLQFSLTPDYWPEIDGVSVTKEPFQYICFEQRILPFYYKALLEGSDDKDETTFNNKVFSESIAHRLEFGSYTYVLSLVNFM